MFKVKDEYRKNDLSLEPGGSEVHVVYSGETRVYDKVKYPQAFADGIINKCKMMGNTLPDKIEMKNKVLWEKL